LVLRFVDILLQGLNQSSAQKHLDLMKRLENKKNTLNGSDYQGMDLF
jgi:hypothetical protein